MLPIIPHLSANLDSRQRCRAADMARRFIAEQPRLRINPAMRPLVPDRLEDRQTLHLDDTGSIPLMGRYYSTEFIEDRAALRAGAGDVVITRAAANHAFERYREDRLGLGAVEWLHCANTARFRSAAAMAWEDPGIRHALLLKIRNNELSYIHPHIGNHAVWALAMMLSNASKSPVQVIAPHPVLTRCTNNKLWFARTVRKLLGPSRVPLTVEASSYAGLAAIVRHMARDAERLVIKLPDSAGGAGNQLLLASQWRRQRLGAIRGALKSLLTEFDWNGREPILVGCWESDVLCTPSVQTWIPPPLQGDPVIEGIFLQLVTGDEGFFEGSRPADLPMRLQQQLANECGQLCLLFQSLGYVGRCSFDTIVVGPALERCKVHYIECNGRWGGTSAPMTLMNRLSGDWKTRPYASREIAIPGLNRISFDMLLRHFARDIYDSPSGKGSLVFYNPGRMQAHSGIDVIAMADTQREADSQVLQRLPARLHRLSRTHGHSGEDLTQHAAPTQAWN